jgi:hypothetical protein
MEDGKSKPVLLDKQGYFRLSREQGLSNRCPILSRCARRSRTFELVRFRENGSYQIDKPDEPIVSIVGEDSYLAGGNNNFIVGGVCPEVALFESSRFFPGFSGYATTKAQYDKYMDPQDQILETGHFSECAEYALDAYRATHRQRTSEHDRSHLMTNNTYNIGTVQGGAVSLGGDAHNSGHFELQQYPEPVRQNLLCRL